MYKRPTILVDSDLSEGVYAASGAEGSGGVNHAVLRVNNSSTPAVNYGDHAYYNTLSWSYNGGDHSNGGMKVVLTYDKPVTFIDMGTPFVKLESGNGTTVLYIDVALGSKYAGVSGATITVSCDSAPSLTSATATCYGC